MADLFVGILISDTHLFEEFSQICKLGDANLLLPFSKLGLRLHARKSLQKNFLEIITQI